MDGGLASGASPGSSGSSASVDEDAVTCIEGQGESAARTPARDDEGAARTPGPPAGVLAFGGAHHDTISAHSHMGSLLVAQGRLDEAEPYVDRALEGMKSGRLAADRASVEFDRARILAARGRKDEAAALARGASTVLKGAGPDWAAKSGEIDGWIAALAGAG